MGCVFRDRRSGGCWALKYHDADGSTRRERTDAKDKTLARRLLSARLNEVAEAKARGLASIDGLRVDAAPVVTFKQAAEEFRLHVKAHNAVKTIERYGSILDALISRWGTLDVRAVTPALVQARVDERLTKKAAPATVKVEAAVLTALMNMARRAGHVQRNPMEGVRLPRVQNQIVRFLSEVEEENLLARLPDDLRLAVRFAIATGLRDAEQRGLCWSNIDFVANVLTVRGKGGKQRQIPLCQHALAVLGEIPRNLLHPEVFLLDGHARQRQFGKGRLWTRALKAAGLDDVHWHLLRHTFCSRLAQRGASLQTIAELAGHASIAMTMRYAHLTADTRARAVRLLDLPSNGTHQGTHAAEADFPEARKPAQVLEGTTGRPIAFPGAGRTSSSGCRSRRCRRSTARRSPRPAPAPRSRA